MGYRDDETALAARRDLLDREVATLRQEHDELSARGATLAGEVRRKRWRLRLRLTLRWMRQHPKLMFCAVLALSIVAYTQIKGALAARAHRLHVARVLGKGCTTKLRVVSQPTARLLINDLEVGKTPVTVPICPGPYRLRLVHAEMIPWQRKVSIDGRAERKVNASLVPWHPSLRPKDGILIESRPAGALAFVDGREIGRTPLLLRASMLAQPLRPGVFRGAKRTSPRVLLGVVAPGYQPFVKRVLLRGRDLWVALSPAKGARR
jgi:hypothetical protein